MQIGFVGLGKMGASMAMKLCRADIHVVGFDSDAKAVDALATEPGFNVAYSLDAMLNALQQPRKVWVMLPAGKVTNHTLEELRRKLAPGDLLVNGGNSFYKETVVFAESYRNAGIQFVDAGVSGGVHGFDNGYCIMAGGESTAIQRAERQLNALSPQPNQWLHVGPSGAGHYVKMVHNGIEYGLMAAYAEGLNLLATAGIGKADQTHDAETTPLRDPQYYQYDFDLESVTELWRRGSVVSSWLLDLTAAAFHSDPHLSEFEGRVSDSGEGRWTALAAIDEGVPIPVIAASLFSRFSSRGNDLTANKILSAMRKQFGGHAEKKDVGGHAEKKKEGEGK